MSMQQYNNKSSKTVYVKFYIKKCVGIQCLSPLFVLFSYSSYDGLRTRVYTTVVLPTVVLPNCFNLRNFRLSLAKRPEKTARENTSFCLVHLHLCNFGLFYIYYELAYLFPTP